MLLSIILATSLVSLLSLVGLIFVFGKERKPTFFSSLISLAAGALLTVAFLDLLPEAISNNNQIKVDWIFTTVLVSILFFFLLEKVLHWHHCRCEDCGDVHDANKNNLVYINLAGNTIHNLIDGFLVASAFMLSLQTGLIVTLAVMIHEIPHEFSDFGILVYAGLGKFKALFLNFLTALAAIIGSILFYFFGSQFQSAIPLMAAFAAGNFIYLSTADLIPELHHETNPNRVVAHSAWLLVGALIMFVMIKVLPHA
jgi:zinc and cadmium transporter